MNGKVTSLIMAAFLLVGVLFSLNLVPVSKVLGNLTDTVSLSSPCIEGLQVDINGVASPGQNAANIVFNWGDGSLQNHFFSNEHMHKSSGSYVITVTTHYNDGFSPFAQATVTAGSGIGTGCSSLLVSS